MKKWLSLPLISSVALCCYTPVVSALEFSGTADVGLEATDNSRKTTSNEQDELIVSAGVSGTFRESTGPFTADATASARQEHYTEDTFGDQTLFNLRGTANWEILRDRLNLQVQDFYRQTAIDTLAGQTPSNSQDTNIFSVSPILQWSPAARHQISLTPAFRDYYYEETPTDNQQLSLTADWLYALFRTMSVGAGVNVTDTNYDDEVINDNYTITSPYLIVLGGRPNFDYRVNLGFTEVERDNRPDEDGSTAEATINYQLSDRSRLRLRMASLLTDVNQDQFNSLQDSVNGNFENEQITSDVLKNKIFRLQYELDGNKLGSMAWIELRDLDYSVNNALDREVQEIGVNLGYRFNSLMTFNARAIINETELTQTPRTDDSTIFGVGMDYRLSRQLRTSLYLQYEDEESTTAAGSEYDETSLLWRLIYEFGRVQ